LVRRELAKGGEAFEITRVETLEEFIASTQATAFDAILADYRLPGFTALDAWDALPELGARPPFILLSGAIGEAAAVAAIHLGISDYLHKDDLGALWRVIHRALEVFEAKQAQHRANQELAQSQRRLAQFADHLQATIDSERAAIAREIHDDIGGSLAAVKLDLAWLTRHSTSEASKDHLASATEMLQHALGASQRIMMNLRPAILDQGLYAALQWLTLSFEKRTGIKTQLLASHEIPNPDKPIQLAAYRTTQEALTNVSKYAQATAVWVEVSDAEEVLTVEIRDNGQGIADADFDKPQSFGIRGLRERARTVSGWLDVSTRAGQGTSIILSVPLTEQARTNAQEDFQ
jgi:signal transduction histidine kinase